MTFLLKHKAQNFLYLFNPFFPAKRGRKPSFEEFNEDLISYYELRYPIIVI